MPEQPAMNESGPWYINEVERVIGVRFFPEPYDTWVEHNDPVEISPETMYTYTQVYIGALRLLADSRLVYNIPRDEPFSHTDDELRETRAAFAEERERLIHHLTSVAQVAEVPRGAMTETQLLIDLEIGDLMLQGLVDELSPILITIKRDAEQKHGFLYFPEEEVRRMHEAARQVVFAGPKDVPTNQLITEWQITEADFYAAALVTGRRIAGKRIPGTRRYAFFVSAIDALFLDEYLAELHEFERFYTVAQIADEAGVTPETARDQIVWHKYEYVPRLRCYAYGKLAVKPCLSEEQAVVIIQELRVIIPDEYLTIGEYARLRKMKDGEVRHIMEARDLTAHIITNRDTSTMYLDGAMVHRIDQIRAESDPERMLKEGKRAGTENVASTGAKLYRGSVPEDGINMEDLAAFHKTTPNTMYARILRAIGLSGEIFVGKYLGRGRLRNYFLKEELHAIGIAVPGMPPLPSATPVARGRASPRPAAPSRKPPVSSEKKKVDPAKKPGRRTEEPFEMTATKAQVKRPSPKPYKPGDTLRDFERPGSSQSAAAQYRRDLSRPPLDVTRVAARQTDMQTPRHLPEEPGRWRPEVTIPSREFANTFISITEKLTAEQIAERLGIRIDAVQEAIARIDPGGTQPEVVEDADQAVELYGGKMLVAIREQLVGIPLGYIQFVYKLTDEQMARARRFLARNKHKVFEGDRYSPGAIEFLVMNLATLTQDE